MEHIKEFITNEERLELLQWVDDNRGNLTPNRAGPHRNFCTIHKSVNNDIAVKIENRIKDRFNLNNDNVKRQLLGSFMSVISPKGFVHFHTDAIERGDHHRFNLVIQKPESGGTPIYNGEELDWNNGDLLCYRPDRNLHGSKVVEGNLDRIVMSCGWLIV